MLLAVELLAAFHARWLRRCAEDAGGPGNPEWLYHVEAMYALELLTIEAPSDDDPLRSG